MKLITLYLPETYIKALDQLVDEHFYPNRAEAIRSAIRDILVENKRFQAQTDYKAPPQSQRTAFSRRSTIQKEA
jgi:Arc/MetJ-type ribon-helix-helix transcriptional regulator